MWEKYHEPSNYVECSKLLSKYIHKGHNLPCYRFIEPIKTYQCCLGCCKHVLLGGPMAGIPFLIACVRCVALKILWKSWSCTPWSIAWNGCDKCRWPFFSGWCFGTFWFFHSVGNVIPTDELIFFRGVGQPPTSNPYQMITLRLINSITSCSP